MRHNCVAKKLGRSMSHRKALMCNMVTSLVLESQIKTTLPKAKSARRDAERMVTIARKGTLASRRRVAAFLKDPDAVRRLIDVVVPTLAKYTNGGFTRILKLGTRRGDAAQMCLLEWVAIPPKVSAPAAGDAAEAAKPVEEAPKAVAAK
jgi:large subunit ribosomal protein L17